MDSHPPSPDPLHGLNPESLMAAAAMPTDGDADTLPLTRRDLPSLEEIAAAFPDLEVLDLIGHGGMSAVFKARQPKLDRMVALKVLPKSLAATPGFPERFTREGRVLARLSHPNIVAVHDFGESGGFCFLIMEYVDGVNLRQAMRAGRFTPEQALNIIPAICDALQFAHTQGVLHRDIKPENILLDSRGRVKIADFGIAKILDEKGDAMLLTQSGAKLGTAPYMAPEQIEKPSSVDHRADIYSLGVVFYEMLTGELPLGRFAAPSEKSSVGGNIDEIVFRALEKERTRRQQSVDEFKTQVEGAGSMPRLGRPMRLGDPFEYQSKRRFCGMPLLHITSGIDPDTGKRREAHGFVAVGGRARGIFAFGAVARGWFAFGGVAIGLVAFGGVGIGVVSFGGLALGLLLAYGVLGLGTFAVGGLAAGYHAVGGLALGWHGVGAMVLAHQGYGAIVHAAEVMTEMASMPFLTHALYSTRNWSYFLILASLPVSTLIGCAQSWGREQAAAVAGGSSEGRVSRRIFWAVPAMAVFGAVWAVLMRMLVDAVEPSTPWVVVPSGITIIGLLFFILALPLWLRLVPMNSFYGVRLPSTFASDERWYDVNAVFGKHLFWWSLLVMGAGIAGFYQLPRHQDAYPWAAITLSMVAVAASVVVTLWWMRQHPVDGPVRQRNRLASWSGQAVIAVVIAMFIKSFIAGTYKVPQGNEPGVAKNSHWFASHLDTGFSTGNLVIFQHESGHYWIARVVAREDKGLRLKRGGSPDEFFMPWDKIVGKMLFSHFSPDALSAAGNAASVPPPSKAVPTITQGTSQALEQSPVLRFTRLKLNNADWRWPVHAPDGSMIENAASQPLINSSASTDMSGPDAEDSRWQLWFEHPDFDRRSMLQVSLTAFDGAELPSRDSGQAGPAWDSLHLDPPLRCVVVSPGMRGNLPPAVRVVLRYSVGPWRKGREVASTFHGGMSLGIGHLAGIGEGQDRRAFLSWAKKKDDWQPYVIAHLRTGSWIDSQGSLTSGGEEQLVHQFAFEARLADVELFETRTRAIKTVVFDKVVLPPLPDDENAWVTVSGGTDHSGPVKWAPGLTVAKAIGLAGGVSWKAPKKIRLIRDCKTEDFSFKLATEMETKPGDQIIIPE